MSSVQAIQSRVAHHLDAGHPDLLFDSTNSILPAERTHGGQNTTYATLKLRSAGKRPTMPERNAPTKRVHTVRTIDRSWRKNSNVT